MAQATQEFGDWPLKRLMTDVCGSGHKSADDLTRAQATEAFERILADEPDPTTLGAFWLANRWKRNTAEELGAYVDVMCERVEYAEPDADPVDCGANYDGKGRSAILGVAAGVVAAAAGTPVVVHSGDRVPTQKQDAYKHVLDELGVHTELTPSDSADMVDETGFGFYYQPAFNPAIDDLFDRRDQMGVRTFVNDRDAGEPRRGVGPPRLLLPPRVREEGGRHVRRKRVPRPRPRPDVPGDGGYDDVRPPATPRSPSGTRRAATGTKRETPAARARPSTTSRSRPPSTGWTSKRRTSRSTTSRSSRQKSPRRC